MRGLRDLAIPFAIASMVLWLGIPSSSVHAALAPHVPGEILIKFRSTAQASDRAAIRQQVRGQRLRDLTLIGVEHVRLADADVEGAIEKIRRHPLIEYVEPNYEVYALVVPNDPQFSQLYGLHNTGQTGGTPGADINAPEAWDMFTGDPDLLVGVVDTGVDYTHPDLAANIWTNPGEIAGNGQDDDENGFVDDVHGYDFVNNDGNPMDDNGHGTHVSGTIAAIGNNGIGVAGINWQAKIVAVKFLGAGGSGSITAAVQAMQYLHTMGVKLSNHSWGGPFSQAFLEALNAAGADGHLIVAAAGNAGSNIDLSPTYPAAYDTPYRLTVAASDHNDHLADFSNYGLGRVHLAAPGVDILSTVPGGGYATLSGTSMAAPHATGVMALVMGRFPNMTSVEARNHLLLGVDAVSAFDGITVTGGRLNAQAAVFEPDDVAPGPIADLSVGEIGSTTVRLHWTATGDDGTEGRARRYELRYSLAPITEQNFGSATVALAPRPADAGAAETTEISGLAFTTTYYFALRAVDETQNTGPISNLVSATTLGIPDITASPTSFSHQLFTGATDSQTLTLRNDGAGTLDFSIPTPAILQATSVPSMEMAKGATDPRTGDPVTQGSGGPDGFGYRWVDSDEPGGPTYDWVDISSVGQEVPIYGDDMTSEPIPLGFSFPFYGSVYSSVRVCTNGFISFTDPNPAYINQPLPSPLAPANLIAGYWDDLMANSQGLIRTYNDGHRFIILWSNLYLLGGEGPYTFQVILEPNGAIQMQYLIMPYLGVSSGTTGIQNGNRTIGLTTAFNTPYVRNALAIRFVRVPQWLRATPATGRIAAGQSAQVQLLYDTFQMSGGVYQSNLLIQSNDPDENPLQLPVSLTVIGAPDIRVSPATLDFGQRFVGYPGTQDLQIRNAGTDVLQVSGVSCADPSVTALPASFTLAPGDSQVVSVTWAPGNPGTLSAPLIVSSNDPGTPTVSIPTQGTAVPPPQIQISPTSISTTLTIPESETRTVRLTNIGLSPLIWEMAVGAASAPGPLGGSPPEMVVSAPPVPGTPGITPPFDPPTVWGPDPRRQPAPPGALPMPPVHAMALPAVILDPAGDGGSVDLVALRGDGAQGLRIEMELTSPILVGNFGGYLSLDTDRNPQTGIPPTFGAPGQDIGAEYEALLFNFASGVVLVYRTSDGMYMGGFPVQVVSNVARFTIPLAALGDDDGSVDVTGVIGTSSGPTDWFPDAGHGTIYSAPWLTAAPTSGTIDPGQAIDIQVTLETAELIGGTYEAALSIQSNDPDGDESIPVTLVAIGTPDIAVLPQGLSFGTLLVGQAREMPILFKNFGSDVLHIASASFDHPAFSFVGPGFPAQLAPGDSVLRIVSFAPVQVCQPCTGTLSLVTNDPDENPALVPLMGTGNPPPELLFSPAHLAISLPIPGTGTRPLTLQNLGPGPLTWSFPISAGGVAQQVYPGLEVAKGAIDPRPGVLGQGGPDGFGYRWRDSDEPGGPGFGWIDIVGTGQTVPIQGDDMISQRISMGMEFPYYGNTYDGLYVCTNGFVSFTPTAPYYSNQPLPSLFAPPNLLAAYWDDLWVETTSSVWVRADGDRFVVSWVGVRHLGGDGPYTFQLILERSGRIVYQYLDMTSTAASGTVGLQDHSQMNGLSAAFNAPYVHDGLAVAFSRFPGWLGVSPASGTLAPGGSVQVDVAFDTQGLFGGVHADVLTLETNDPDERLTHIPVELTAIGIPDVSAAPASLDFGSLLVGMTRDLPLNIVNTGTDALHITSLDLGSPAFTLVGPPPALPLVITPQGSAPLTVRFAPGTPCAPCTGALVIHSDDPDENPFEVALTGVGLPPPAMAVDPEILVVTQALGQVQHWPLTISNPGQSPLEFRFRDFAEPEPPIAHSEVTLARDEIDTRPGVLGRGGPDAFGYRWRDSDEGGGPAFQWINIVGEVNGGTRLPFQFLDQNITGVPIGFAFPYYGGLFANVNVCTHGWFSFSSQSIQWTNYPLPSDFAPENLVAPFWDDLNVPAPGGQVWYQARPDRFVITWFNVRRTAGGGPLTFQAVLYPSGRIVFQFLDMRPPIDQGTVGIQNQSRNVGLMMAFNAPYVHDNLAIEISRVPAWLSVNPVSGVVPPGTSQVVQARITTEELAADVFEESLALQSNVPNDSLDAIPVYLNAGVTPNVVHAPAADFGIVYVGYPEQINVSLENSGPGVLRIDSADVTGAGFTRVSNPPALLRAGDSAPLTLRYGPEAPCDPCVGGLSLGTNDPDTPVSTMTLDARGLPPPVIDLTPDSLGAAAATTLGADARERYRSIQIQNTGGSDLSYVVQAQLNPPPIDSIPYQPVTMSKGGVDPNPGVLGTGGPDQFGYQWRDSDEPGGPPFAWVDITGVGTVLPIVGDDVTQAGVPIGFEFPFYGTNFSAVNVCSNGFLSFTNPTTQYWNVPLPYDQAPENLLAPWWTDLFVASPKIWVHNDGTRFIVSWVDVRHLSGVGRYSFQVILFPSGRYRFQYLLMEPPIANATIGVQDGHRTDGLTVAYNSPYVHNAMTIEFGSPPRWLSASPTTGVIPPGQSATVQVGFHAAEMPDGEHHAWLQINSNDPARSAIDYPCRLNVGVTNAVLNIDPQAINRDAQGIWVGSSVELPAGLDVHDIAPGTVRIQREIPLAPGAPISYPDADQDGLAEMDVKFARASLMPLLSEGESVPVEVAGEVDGLTWFQAFDAVRVFTPTGHRSDEQTLYQAGSTTTLQWTATGASSETFDLWFSSDAGDTWTLVEGGMTANLCDWTVPLQVTDNGRLELVSSDDQGHLRSLISQQFRVVSGSVGVDETGAPPVRFALELAGPSPARGRVDLRLGIPEASEVEVSVFDVRGARVRELDRRAFAAGWHRLGWNGRDGAGHAVAPGVYFLRMKTPTMEATTRVTLLK